VTGTSGHGAPTGQVYIYTDGSGTTAFNLNPGSGANSTFSGNVTSQVLAQGGNIVSLYYTGDNTYNSSSVLLNSGSAIATPGSDYAVSASNGVVAVSATGKNSLSASATSTIYLTPTNGYSGTVNLACSVPGSPTGISCSLSANSVSLSYSNTASVTLPKAPAQKGRNLLAAGGGAVLAFVVLLVVPARRKSWRSMLALLLFACVAGFGIGCGGGGGNGGGGGGCTVNCGGGGGGTTGTATNPSQSVTLTVTAAAGAQVGLHGVTVTATSSSTEQIHTVGILAQVE